VTLIASDRRPRVGSGRPRIACVALAAAAAACGPSGVPPAGEAGADSIVATSPAGAALTEVGPQIGIDAPSAAWPDGTYTLPEITQGGVALWDYDNDDDLDILHVRVPPPGRPNDPAPDRLLEQQADGTFVDVTERSGIHHPEFGQGVVVGDADDDGDLDVYFTNYGRDRLFANNGDRTFSDVTERAGFSGERWSTAGAFCDYDRDGDLDLVVVTYVRFDPDEICMDPAGRRDYCGPQVFHGEPDRLYRNDGGLRFTDVTTDAGLTLPDGGDRSRGLGVLCVDLTRDGLADIYVANDGESNQLWVNRGDGTFVDEAVVRGVAVSGQGRPEGSMGVAVGDVNGDNFLDVFIADLVYEHNRLYVGSAGPLFFDRTAETGLGVNDLQWTGFGTAMFDFDHDADLDVLVANGGVRRGIGFEDAVEGEFWVPYAEPNLVMANRGDGTFRDVGALSGTFGTTRAVSRALATGDLDDDGDLDVVLSGIDNSLRVFRNDSPPPGSHWLLVRALSGARDAVGAELRLHAGDRTFVGLVLPSTSYLSSNDPRVHFGLGPIDAVDEIVVRWPVGEAERFVPEGVDRRITLRQGTGTPP